MSPDPQKRHTIEVKLQNLEQFFNSMDPSPFHEKDLDHDLEEFIVSWATEYPIHEPLQLVVYLEKRPSDTDARAIIERAVHNYFSYKTALSRRELREVFRRGRLSLVIGLSFLTLCLSGAELVEAMATFPGKRLLRESLIIAGWVAMWHPIETYLYGWWPVRREARVYQKLSTIPVEVRNTDAGPITALA